MGKMRIRRIIAMALGTVLTAGMLSGCSNAEENVIVIEKEKKKSNYSLTQAERKDVILSDVLVLQYTQKEQADQYFKLSGYTVKDLYVEKGDMVKKGDLLGELNRPDLEEEIHNIQLEIDECNVTLKLLEERKALEYDQADRMLKSGELKNQADYEAYKLKIDEKYAEESKEFADYAYYEGLRLDYYTKQYEDGKLYASMDGMVSYARIYSDSQYASSTQRAITLIDSEKCAFASDRVELAEKFTEGGRYTIKASYGSATYDTVFHMSDDGTQLLFELVEPDYNISIGTKAEISVVKEISSDVVAVVSTAIHHAGDMYYVYYLDENDIRNVVYVTIGLVGDKETEITSGVNAGDFIVTR